VASEGMKHTLEIVWLEPFFDSRRRPHGIQQTSADISQKYS